MNKKPTNKKQERQPPLPQATQAGATELPGADLKEAASLRWNIAPRDATW